MEIKVHLETLYSSEEAKKIWNYLNNKHKGGKNNSKGNSYENFIAVYEIAKSINNSCSKQYTLFSSQAFCFIDDFIIENTDVNMTMYFQIKDVEDLDWKKGSNYSMAEDFEFQKKVGSKNELSIVVSKEEVNRKLLETIPSKIKDFVTVIHFPTATSINTLLRVNKKFKDEIVNVSAIKDPSSDKLDTIATIILGAWDASNKQQVSLQTLLEKCYEQNPHYIKGFTGKVSDKMDSILKGIVDFNFKVENGFIKWSYRNTDNGTLSFPIGTFEYLQWENDVLKIQTPATFENLEPLLY